MWPWPGTGVLGAIWEVTKHKTEKIMNHVFDTAAKMETPQKTTRGKDVMSMELGMEVGKKKSPLKASLTFKVAANSDKGMTLGGGASIEVDKVGSAGGSITTYRGKDHKMKLEAESEVSTGPKVPGKEVGVSSGAASVKMNVVETKNILADAFDSFKKYFKAEADKIKEKIDGNYKK